MAKVIIEMNVANECCEDQWRRDTLEGGRVLLVVKERRTSQGHYIAGAWSTLTPDPIPLDTGEVVITERTMTNAELLAQYGLLLASLQVVRAQIEQALNARLHKDYDERKGKES